MPGATQIQREAKWLSAVWREYCESNPPSADRNDLFSRIGAFLESAQSHARSIKSNLGEVLLAQGYQDLSGQILRSVIALVDELEVILADKGRADSSAQGRTCTTALTGTSGHGPAVPGVAHVNCVDGQGDIESLLGAFGI